MPIVNQWFKEVYVTVSEDTEIRFWASTHPEGVLGLVRGIFSDASDIPTSALVDADRHVQVDVTGQDMVIAGSTTAPLGANGTYIGSSFGIDGYAKIVGISYADRAGAADGLEIQQSPDNENWDYASKHSPSAGTALAFSVEVVAPYARPRYVNAGTAQGTFR
ncbi:unnamed protein product, partial [marine sediment metagenome]